MISSAPVMPSRDEFSRSTIGTLAKRVGYRCSNPGCRQETAGPADAIIGSVNIGVAAHITAAAGGGPRYDEALQPAERSSIANGIWLCQNCAKLIDADPLRFTAKTLLQWKTAAESAARSAIEGESARTADEVQLFLTRKNVRIETDRHDYRLDVSLRNRGSRVLKGFYLDVHVPTLVVSDRTKAVVNQSNDVITVFRFSWSGTADDVYPNDVKVLVNLPYFMTSKLYWDHRTTLFAQEVGATLYHDDKKIAAVEVRFEDLQIF